MNQFTITVSAIDKATATVLGVRSSFSKLVRPLAEVSRATKGLGAALGLKQIAKDFKEFSITAAKSTAAIGVAGLALYEIERRWSSLGWEVNRTSATLGVSISDLQSLRGAATLAGVSTEDLTAGLKSLGDTLEDAQFGRNQSALMMLNRLGITVKKTADGAVDSVQALKDLSRAIAAIKSPQVQGLVARQFGVEALLPLLRKGPAAIEEMQRKTAELGAVMGADATAAAEKFGIALAGLKLQLEGVRNVMGADLLPIMGAGIKRFMTFTAAHRDLVAAVAIGLPVAALIGGVVALGAALTTLALSPGGLFILALVGGAAAIAGVAVALGKLSKAATPAREGDAAQHGGEHWVPGKNRAGGHFEGNTRNVGNNRAPKYEHWVPDANGGHWEAGAGGIAPPSIATPGIPGAGGESNKFDGTDANLGPGDRIPGNIRESRDRDRVRILQDEISRAPDDPDLKRELAEAMRGAAAGRGTTFTGGRQTVHVEVAVSAPPGTRAAVRQEGGVTANVRIGTSLPGAP